MDLHWIRLHDSSCVCSWLVLHDMCQCSLCVWCQLVQTQDKGLCKSQRSFLLSYPALTVWLNAFLVLAAAAVPGPHPQLPSNPEHRWSVQPQLRHHAHCESALKTVIWAHQLKTRLAGFIFMFESRGGGGRHLEINLTHNLFGTSSNVQTVEIGGKVL